jgi:hypothetical protein
MGTRAELFNYVKDALTIPGRFTIDEVIELKAFPDKINSLNTYELCWIALAIESFPGYQSKICKASDYFEPNEIESSKLYTRSDRDYSNYLELEYCGELAKGQYQCMATVEQIGMLKALGYLRVVPEAQRESVSIRIGDEVLKKIHVNYKRVNKIASAIVYKKPYEFFYNAIRLNVVKDPNINSEIIIDEDERKVLLPNDGITIILDGNHRALACEVAMTTYSDKKDLFKDNKFSILLTNCPIVVAQRVVEQENNREPIRASHLRSMRSTNANKIIDSIVEQSGNNADARYAGQIATTKEQIRGGNGIILKELLSFAIEKIYNTETPEYNSPIVRSNLSNWLIKFFNQIVYILSYEYDNYFIVRNKNWSVSPEAWCGYVYLSNKLRNIDNWENKLENILKSVDFKTKIDYSRSPTKILKSMINYFESEVTDV